MGKVRLHGTQGECWEVAERVRDLVSVLAAASACPDRSASVYARWCREVEVRQLRQARVRRQG